MSVYKRGKGTHWHYYFRVRGVRYRGSIRYDAFTIKELMGHRDVKTTE